MPLWELTPDRFTQVARTSFQESAVLERRDLQRLLSDHIKVLDNDLIVVAEEFSNWEKSDLRIDLLCIDRDANLVVVELKRDDSAGHSELQAIRYAAMVAQATFDQVVEAYRAYRERRHRDDPSQPELTVGQAAQELLEVADLRGDSELSHPADDEKLWTARMQTAWDELRAALDAPPEGDR